MKTITQPTEHDLLAALLPTDPTAVVIRGHILLELYLAYLITQALPAPHSVELDRLSFPFKVDLAVSLCLLKPHSRQLFLKLNQVRNRFAHDARAILDKKTTTELKSSFTEFHHWLLSKSEVKNEHLACLREALVVAFFDLEAASILHKNKRLERQALIDEVEKSLEGKETAKPTHPARIAFQERVEKRMRELEAEEQRMASSPSNTKD
jgi:hypothetical protein